MDLQAVEREKGKGLEREAMSEQGRQVVQEGQGLLELELLELESGEDLELGLEQEQGVDPQEGTLQVH